MRLVRSSPLYLFLILPIGNWLLPIVRVIRIRTLRVSDLIYDVRGVDLDRDGTEEVLIGGNSTIYLGTRPWAAGQGRLHVCDMVGDGVREVVFRNPDLGKKIPENAVVIHVRTQGEPGPENLRQIVA